MATTLVQVHVESPSGESVRHLLSAMMKTGGGSVLSSLFSAVTVKLVASMLGPVYISVLATLQQIRQATLTAATANGQTALVQGGAFFRGREREEYLRTVLLLFVAGTVLSSAGLVAAREPVARMLLGSNAPAMRYLVAWLALPVALGSGLSYLSGLLNAYRALGRLAITQVAGSLGGCIAVYPVAWIVNHGQPLGLLGILTVSAATSLTVAAIMLRPYPVRGIISTGARWISVPAVRHFLAISGAMFGTGLLGSAVLLTVRSGVIRSEGLYRTGLFDAAWSVSMNYVTLLLSSFQAYYLPTLSRTRTATERRELMGRVFRVCTLALIPIVTSMVVLKPAVLLVLYSGEFRGSAEFLRWTLVGDYLKVTSWILAMPMLALADMKAFVLTEATVQLTFLFGARLLAGMQPPAEAAAISFLGMYTVNLGCCYAYARARCSFAPSRSMVLMWLSGMFLILTASVATWTDYSVDLRKAAAWVLIAVCLSAAWVVGRPAWFREIWRKPAS